MKQDIKQELGLPEGIDAKLDGAISGRALYDGVINVPEAAAFLKS